MTVLGNIFLVLATFIYVVFLSEVYDDKTHQAHSTDLGSRKRIALLLLSFLACMGVAALATGLAGGFDWVSSDHRIMWSLVCLGLLCIVFIAAQSARFRFEPRAPWSLRYLTGVAPFVFPAVVLLATAVLLNAPVRELIPVPVYRIPLMLFLGISLLACVAGMVEWGLSASKGGSSELSNPDPSYKRHLAEISAANPLKSEGFIHLLAFTDSRYSEEVRVKALNKIKSNPNWAQVMVEALQGETAPPVFTFLASNTVENRALFADPIREGILQLAAGIRNAIRQASGFQADQFSWDIDRMLATVENFKDMGVDYLPAMREVRAALDEPGNTHGLKQVAFTAADTLDWWIKNYRTPE